MRQCVSNNRLPSLGNAAQYYGMVMPGNRFPVADRPDQGIAVNSSIIGRKWTTLSDKALHREHGTMMQGAGQTVGLQRVVLLCCIHPAESATKVFEHIPV